MNYTNYLLTLHWFKNTIDNKLNDEILLIILNLNHKERLEKIEKLEKDLGLDNKKHNYESFDISKVESFNDLKDIKKNALVIAHDLIDINKISNLECNILLCFYNDILECNSLETKGKLKTLSKEDTEEVKDLKPEDCRDDDFYDSFIKKNNPLDIIFSNDDKIISKCISSRFIKNSFIIFKNINILQSNRVMHKTIWEEQIQEDIFTLLKYKILTARLAVAIYKSSTLRLNDSNKKIGLYYHNELGIKSKLIHIPKSKPSKKIKAYHLKDNNI
ncbi:hypothetical protein OZZ08_08410 [Malaciobacter mytili]|uniref:hypothetical protein n=1 Tax=Malaciobacter mytili TaxID=603050 RepID=UPI003BB03BF0